MRGRRGDAVERTANSVGCAELIIEIVRVYLLYPLRSLDAWRTARSGRYS